MYHSITFGNKNTWSDWCIIPTSDPIISLPSVKTNYVDVPGGNGSLDMSEVLTKYPVYNNREGSLSFVVMNRSASHQPECNPLKFRDLVAEISDHLHGHRMQMILEDDPEYYYEGRFEVESTNSNINFNEIVIKYILDPYKWTIRSTVDNWIWDTFNFETGVISRALFYNLNVTTTQKVINFTKNLIGSAPVMPDFVVNATTDDGIMMRLVNEALGIDRTLKFQNGTRHNPDFFLYGDDVKLYYWVNSGTGTLTVEYKKGRL